MTHIRGNDQTIIGQRQWLVAWSTPSHYLNQVWCVYNWNLGNKFRWNLNRNTTLFIQKNEFENAVCKRAAICLGLKADVPVNTLRPRQHGRHFADDTFKRIFLNWNIRISMKISLKFIHKGPINNIPALVQIMAWRRPGGKPLSEPMMVSLLTHICVARPQWAEVCPSECHDTKANTF